MAELSFAKTFLAVLDTKATKITADHVEDPRNYQSRTPYTLPRMPKPMSKPPTGTASSTTTTSSTAAPGSEPGISITVKSLRNPPLDVKLPAPVPAATTSVLDVKTAVAAQTGLPLDKLRLLYGKKPAADSKALRDLVNTAAGETVPATMEFSVMVLGGAATLAAAEAARKSAAGAGAGSSAGGDVDMTDGNGDGDEAVAQGMSGRAVLETGAFWDDLKGFLQQRIRDEKVAEEACERFKEAWSR